MACKASAEFTTVYTATASSNTHRHQTAPGDRLEKSVSRSGQQWAEIQPRFKHLYINLDMTLRDCIATIEEEYDFHASDQMYKKRIKAWGLSKSVKARYKDDAIADLIHCRGRNRGSAAATRPLIRTDKIIRHAQSRVKAGQLDPDLFRQLQAHIYALSDTQSDPQSNAQPTPEEAANTDDPLSVSPENFVWLTSPILSQTRSRSSSKTDILTPSTSTSPTNPAPTPSLPSPLAKFDLFLRSFHIIIAKERTEWLTARRLGTSPPNPSTIVHAFTKGMQHWSHSDFTSARICFSAAAQTFVADLQCPSGPIMSRMTYFVGAPVWDQIDNPVALGFRDFMVRAASENLGRENPLTLMFEGLGVKQSIDMQLAVWAAGMDLYAGVGAEMHMYGMARQRWVWCRENGLLELAAFYRRHAAEEMARVGLLSAEMVREADRDLGVAPEVFVVDSGERGV